MQVRSAQEKDIPSIVELLKLSLGESLMPKSESFWRWKHIDNPFGKSPVLLAFENDKLVGVRAMMLWDWVYQGKIYKAARAVDTATHPDFHGKGIFKNLTMSILEECRSIGVEFIFNTPNQSSKPGYIKMGWMEAGRLPVSFKVFQPFRIGASMLGLVSRRNQLSAEWITPGSDNRIDELVTKYLSLDTNQICTSLSSQYLKWRYVDVPVAKYLNVSQGNDLLSALVIGRIKDSKFGREMRITECIHSGDVDARQLNSLIRDKAKSLSVDFITVSGVSKAPGFWLTLPVGPAVTILDLKEFQHFDKLIKFGNWAPTLGDLELF